MKSYFLKGLFVIIGVCILKHIVGTEITIFAMLTVIFVNTMEILNQLKNKKEKG